MEKDKIKAEDDIGALELGDIIDVQAIQAIMNDSFSLLGIASGLIDIRGKVLVANGWQDICTKFHRVHPESCKHCIESDTILSGGIEPGTFKIYKCKNNLWDVSTPIVIGGKHLGNLFCGQLFFKDEGIDYDIFRAQARKYGFDEEAYFAALERVPRYTRAFVNDIMNFYGRFASMISMLSYSNLKLTRTLTERKKAEDTLLESRQRFQRLVEMMYDLVWETDSRGHYTYVSPRVKTILGYEPEDVVGKTPFELMSAEEVQRVTEIFGSIVSQQKPIIALENINFHKDGHPVVLETSGLPFYDAHGSFAGYRGTYRDVTERKRAEEALQADRNYLNNIISSSPAVVCGVAIDGTCSIDSTLIQGCNI